MKIKEANENIDIDKIFQSVGDIGVYQLFLVCLVSFVAFLPSFVGFSFSFYAATPGHRYIKKSSFV